MLTAPARTDKPTRERLFLPLLVQTRVSHDGRRHALVGEEVVAGGEARGGGLGGGRRGPATRRELRSPLSVTTKERVRKEEGGARTSASSRQMRQKSALRSATLATCAAR